MTPEEAIRVIEVVKAECEWNAPLEYQEAFKMAIEALKEQPEHSQNTSSKQPDLETLGIKTGETCEDVISRRDAIDNLKRHLNETDVPDSYPGIFNAIEEWLSDWEVPSAQPERKKGEWIDKSGGIEGAWNYCSVCWEQAIDLYDFCPNCGADMRGELDG